MKTTIFGAGAVGGHMAARLGAAGADVSAVCRGAQLAAVRERGITLHIHDERYHARIRATDRPETLGHQDLVIVTLKSSVLPDIASSIATLVGPDTSVVFAMNGIGGTRIGPRPAPRRPICRRSIPTARSPTRSATSGSSAAWSIRRTKSSNPVSSATS